MNEEVTHEPGGARSSTPPEGARRHEARGWLAATFAVSLVAAVVGVFALAANPASAAAPEANTVCHALGNGSYNAIPPSDSGIASGHLDHEDDIIPGLKNWGTTGQAIWNNNCVVPSGSPSGSGSPSPSDGGSAMVPICAVSGPGTFTAAEVRIDALIDKPEYTVNSAYIGAIFATLTPESYSWLEETVPGQGNQTALSNGCVVPTPTVTVTATAPGTTTTVTVPGPTTTVTATPTASATVSASPVGVIPSPAVTAPSVGTSVSASPVGVVPLEALNQGAVGLPNAVNAGEGGTQQGAVSPVGLLLIGAAGCGIAYSTLTLIARRRADSMK